VDKKYYNLVVFLLQKAKENKINISEKSIFRLEEGHDVMFYYMIDKDNNINFTVYDYFMSSIEIDSNTIKSFQLKHPN
jgi:tyrosyl-tRNA synthetase